MYSLYLYLSRRLFLDYHGLKLLWGWMIDASSGGDSPESIQFKLDILSTLSCLPVPNKTMLLDSKLISIVEKWTTVNETSQKELIKKEDDATVNDAADAQNQTEPDNRVTFSSS